MTFEEMVVALVASTGAFALVGYLAAKTFGLIKAWINRKNSSIQEEQFNRLAKAFMEYKEDTTKRIQHLEAIIANEDTEETSSDSREIEAPKEGIEIEANREPEQEQPQQDDNNLRNMLRE